jgi:hypothetical protein
MSFSDTVKEAKATFAATAETEKAPDVDANLAQATVFQLHETQHPVPQNDMQCGDIHVAAERRAGEDDEEVELRMPGSFDFGNNDGGVPGAATVDPFDAVSMLRNLWRHMQLE